MDKLMNVLATLLPILVMLGIGIFCRKKEILNDNILAGIKRLIMDVLMPVMIFSVTLSTTFSPTLLIMAAMSFVMNGAGLGVGKLTQRFLGDYGTYHPYMLSGYEVGFLGYPLFPLLFGANSLGFLASMDVGNCIFFFCVYLPAVQAAQKNGARDAKQTIKNIFTSPCLIACLLGLLLSAVGLGQTILTSSVGPIVEDIFSMVTSPMTAMILIVVGYSLKIDKETIVPVLKTSGLRLLSNALLCILGIAFLNLIGITDKLAIYSLIFMSALCTPYALTIYAEGEKHLSFISTQVSLYSIVTFAVFIVLQIVI